MSISNSRASRALAIVRLRLRSWFRRSAVDRELQRELQLHFDELTAEYRAQGLSDSEAVNAARRDMGASLAQIEDQCRDQRSTGIRDRFTQDLQHALRVLRRSPVFAMVAILSLALGIGANALMFSLVRSILLKPLPYANPSQLYALTKVSPRMPAGVVLPPEFAAWHEENHVFQHLAAWNDAEYTLTNNGIPEPQHVAAARISADCFRTLGIAPVIGRDFTATDDGSTPVRVVILSHALWSERFGSDPGILNRTLALNSQSYAIVGVLPAGFRFSGDLKPDLYLPGGYSGPANWSAAQMSLLRIIGRLRDDSSLTAVASDLAAIDARHASEIPAQYRRAFQARTLDLAPLRQKLVGDVRPVLLILSGVVALIMLITCTNLAALQLARGFTRSGELAIRLALGSGRSRLVSLFLTENLLLAAAGGVLGVAAAYALIPLVRTLDTLHLASPSDLTLDPVTLAVACALALVCAFLCGLGPALRAAQLNLNEVMKNGVSTVLGAAWSDRVRPLLVTAQIAVALVLVLGAGLLTKSALHILNNPIGMQPAHLFTAVFRVDPNRYANDQALSRLGDDLLAHMTQLPGVDSVALTSALPFRGYSMASALYFEGRDNPARGARPSTPVIAVTPDYFRTLEIPVLAGRPLMAQDRAGSAPAVVINHSFANRFYPRANPIGQHLRWGPDGAPMAEIVGIVADVRHRGQDLDPQPELFVPFAQHPHAFLALAIRSPLPIETLAPSLRQAFASVDPAMPLFDIASMDTRISRHAERRRLLLVTLSAFSVLAFLIAITGVYGVMSYTVTRRTREFGLRLALGARPADITMDVVRRGLVLTAAGLITGTLLGWVAARELRSVLYDVSPHDRVTFCFASVLILVAAVLASYLPARLAARTDPVRALRWE